MQTSDIIGGEKSCQHCVTMPANAFQEGVCASEAIAVALASSFAVEIPKLPFPLLLDRPIVLSSGQRLSVHPETVVHMMDGCGGIMVRNANPADGRIHPLPAQRLDHDMLVEGGIWEESPYRVSPNDPNAVIQSFGSSNRRFIDSTGREIDPTGAVGDGGHLLGVFFFCNARNLTIRNVTIRRGDFYGILIAGCDHFIIEDIDFDHHKKDGVHINGPSSYGVVRRMKGKTGDDFVALNAWDWGLSAVTFGPIHHIFVQDIDCTGDEIRLLPGRKLFEGGAALDCDIHDCHFSHIRNAYCFKLYQQPNCHNDLTGWNDKSPIPGVLQDITFEDVELNAITAVGLGEVKVTALFEICADCDRISFNDIRIALPLSDFRAAGMRVVEVGPKSSTWKRGFSDPKMWAELFDPELICTAKNLSFKNITFAEQPCSDEQAIVGCHRLQPNPDYPNTTPKGGTGYGVIENYSIEA